MLDAAAVSDQAPIGVRLMLDSAFLSYPLILMPGSQHSTRPVADAALGCRYNDIYAIFTGTLGGLFGAAVVLASALLISLGAYVPVGPAFARLRGCLRGPPVPATTLPRVHARARRPAQPVRVRE